MKNSILFAFLLIAFVFVASCKEESTEPVVTPDFELNGTWYGTDFHPHDGGDPVDFSFTFTNTGFNATYGFETMAGSIKSYDNAANTFVFLWTSHPSDEIQGKFQKFSWTENRVNGITLQPYAEQETQAAAGSTTDIGEYPTVDMHRTNTSTCATPVITPASGTYTPPQIVSISCSTSGATIRYTTDGSDPNATSAVYTNPITILTTTTIKAKAFKTYWSDSAVASSSLVFSLPPASMVFVEGGAFSIGTPNVTLSSFYMSKYEVTQYRYLAVMGSFPSYFNFSSNRPVEQVTWFNAIEYCNRLSALEGYMPCYSYSSYGTNPSDWPSGWNTSALNHTQVSCNWSANGYRLPTEMEWMFAAKGGTQSQSYTYSGSNNIDNVAWYIYNTYAMGSSHPDYGTHIVGMKAQNELGIYDMSGNVWEWCWDIYGSYPNSSQSNPTGPNSGTKRVRRGGAWVNYEHTCKVSERDWAEAAYSCSDSGFRICRNSN